ncbi:hypothetical protein D3C72_2386970 [compost metagenome]
MKLVTKTIGANTIGLTLVAATTVVHAMQGDYAEAIGKLTRLDQNSLCRAKGAVDESLFG